MDEKRYIIQTPQKKDNWIWIVVIILFTGVLVFIIYLYVKEKKLCVEPNSVAKIKGNYAVQEGLAGKALNTCGAKGNQPCIFTSTSVVDAFSMCSSVPSICTAFSYQATQNIVTFVDENQPFEANDLVMTFIRQVAVDTSSSLTQQQIITENF